MKTFSSFSFVGLATFLLPTMACGLADPTTVSALPGSYASEASWNLSGPFTQNQTMSENIADMFISYMVSNLGAPNSVESELSNAISNSVGSELATMIEGYVPPEFNSNSDLINLLSMDLATINVESDLELIHEKDDLLGLDRIVATERINYLVLETAAGDVDIPVGELNDTESDPVIESNYSTTVVQNSMTVEDQKVDIRYGRLVGWILEESTGVDSSALTSQLEEGIECSPFVDELVSSVGISEVSVAGQTYTLDLQILSDSCQQLEAGLATNTLGMFEPNAALLINGPTSMLYGDDEEKVQQIQSGDNYGGDIENIPSVFSSMLDLSFTANRIND